MKNVGLVILGLFIAFIGHFIALGLAGAGHGWVTPLWISIVLWGVYPLTTVRALRHPSFGVDSLLVFLAIALDAALVVLTVREGTEYFWRAVKFIEWWFFGLWIAIWFAWQLIAIINLVSALSPSRRT
jgi:hypothetical protein